jgi:hypothetical protein
MPNRAFIHPDIRGITENLIESLFFAVSIVDPLEQVRKAKFEAFAGKPLRLRELTGRSAK